MKVLEYKYPPKRFVNARPYFCFFCNEIIGTVCVYSCSYLFGIVTFAYFLIYLGQPTLDKPFTRYDVPTAADSIRSASNVLQSMVEYYMFHLLLFSKYGFNVV